MSSVKYYYNDLFDKGGNIRCFDSNFRLFSNHNTGKSEFNKKLQHIKSLLTISLKFILFGPQGDHRLHFSSSGSFGQGGTVRLTARAGRRARAAVPRGLHAAPGAGPARAGKVQGVGVQGVPGAPGLRRRGPVGRLVLRGQGPAQKGQEEEEEEEEEGRGRGAAARRNCEAADALALAVALGGLERLQ